MSKINDKVILCCLDLKLELIDNKGDIIGALDNVPFREDKKEPEVYIFSDGGHGGILSIKFCPFCGTKIEFRQDNKLNF